MRTGEVSRQTNETQIEIKLDLDGSGKHDISTGIGFLDHMLTHLSVHGLFDLSSDDLFHHCSARRDIGSPLCFSSGEPDEERRTGISVRRCLIWSRPISAE